MSFDFYLTRKLGLLCGAALTTALLSASAAEFPLQFKTVKGEDVMQFPGGYGAYGQLFLKKPDGLKAEPKAISKYPLYGKITPAGTTTTNGMVFRLDESQGDGKGYDQVIFDLNGNGDLTDDPAGALLKGPKMMGMENGVFGPITSTNTIAGGHPVYYAQAYIYTQQFRNRPAPVSQNQGVYCGQIRLKAGWYLETTVELNGVKQKVGLFDGNSNERLGDSASAVNYTPNGNEQGRWFFAPGDMFLVDRNGSGTFEEDILGTETSPFGPILYLGSNPYKVSLLKGCTCLSVERWTEPLAEVALQPQGTQVASVELAREVQPGDWQLLKPMAAGGKIQVPPGNYRLFTCALQVKTAQGEALGLQGTLSTPRKPFAYAVGATNTLLCGSPLQVKTEATKRTAQSWEANPYDPKTDSESVLQINSDVVGQGGETYSSYGKGEGFRNRPGKPTFAVVSADGTKIAKGNLEYG